jgi:hypothetical protein
MAIIITKMVQGSNELGQLTFSYPDYCMIKEQFCRDPDDETFVTIGLGGGTEITKAELITRALDIHPRHPFRIVTFAAEDPPAPPTITDRTDAEVETLMNEWCAEKNAS